MVAGTGLCSILGNGNNNIASGNYTFVGGGNNNSNASVGSVIAGGRSNCICSNPFGDNFIGAGNTNCIIGARNVISGGYFNTNSGYYSTIGGGYGNIICNNPVLHGFIGAGESNTLSGGYQNGILGGRSNTVSTIRAFIIGGNLSASANCTTYTNALSKASGTFRISHPDPSKTASKYLQHSFVESPTRGDNIYRYTITTLNCAASVELPDYYKFLNENDQVWISPKNHFGSAYGIVNSCQSCVGITSNCDGEYNVLVIGTRKDIDAKNGWLGVEIWK